jgi:hypothetical protein
MKHILHIKIQIFLVELKDLQMRKELFTNLLVINKIMGLGP